MKSSILQNGLYTLFMVLIIIGFIFPMQAFGQAGTLKFTEVGHHGNTLTDGAAGSTDIPGITYNIYGVNSSGGKIGNILVLDYAPPRESHYFFIDDGSWMGLPINRLIIESGSGNSFSLKSFKVFDELGESPNFLISGFRDGIPVATQTQTISPGAYIQINLNTDFENVNRVEISNQNGSVTQSFNTFVFENPSVVVALPTISTSAASSIFATGTTFNGNVTSDGGATVTARGFVYSSSNNTPTIGGSGVTNVTSGSGTGTFNETVSGLSPSTTYYFQAYATNSQGTSYGGVESFTTDLDCSTPPDQNFGSYEDIDYRGSITYQCITYTGSDAYVGIGNAVGQAITLSPLFSGSAVVLISDSPGGYVSFNSANPSNNFRIVSFVAEFFGHSNGQVSEVYSIKGYDDGIEVVSVTGFEVKASGTYGIGNAAIGYIREDFDQDGSNSGTLTFGIGWSNIDEIRFFPEDDAPFNNIYIGLDNINFEPAEIVISAPSVNSNTASSINSSEATLNGDVTSDGGSAVSARGFVYSSSDNTPTIGESGVTNVVVGSGTGTFQETVSGLEPSTTYYFQAYATNSEGTSYGGVESFTTIAIPCTGTITIGSTALGAAYSIDGGVLKTSGNATVPASVIVDYLQNTGDLVIESCDGDVVIRENIQIALTTSRTLTFQSSRDIVLTDEKEITASGNNLNLIFWADTDADQSGGVLFDSNTSISSNNGHIWIGGGGSTELWNGLTVGDSYAVGLTNTATGVSETYAGINAVGSSINAGEGNLYLNGKSTQTTYRFGIGTRINRMDMTGNDITILGEGSPNANTSSDTNRGNWGIGVENTIITGSGNILLEGKAGGQNAGSNGGGNHGIFTNSNSSIIVKGSGNLTLIGTGGGNPSISANSDNDGIRLNGGTLRVDTGTLLLNGTTGLHANSSDIDYTNGISESRDDSNALAGGKIILEANEINVASIVRFRGDEGSLIVRPRTINTTIGLGGATGTLQVSSTILSENFENGFKEIIIGSAETGKITIGGSTTFKDNLTLKSSGQIEMLASSSLTGQVGENASLVLWSDAIANGTGNININELASINTNGGHIWMGSGQAEEIWNDLTGPEGATVAGYAINVESASLNSGTGDIRLIGKSTNNFGIRLISNNSSNRNVDLNGANIHLIGSSASTAAGARGVSLSTSGSGGSELNVSATNSIFVQGELPTTNGNPIHIVGGGGGLITLDAQGGNIDLTANKININGTATLISEDGKLNIYPIDPNTSIGIGGTAGSLLLSSNNFSTHFADGFSEIIVGNNQTGLITLEGDITYHDPLTIKSNGSIIFNSNANVSSPFANNLKLWSRASGNNEATDANYGKVWMLQGSSVNSGGGDIIMGGGSDPLVGFAFGDSSVPSTDENSARNRGVTINGSINAAGGNITINGKASNSVSNGRGVSIGATIKTSNNGNITINGIARGISDAIALGDSWFNPSAIGILENENGYIFLDGKPTASARNGINVSTPGSFIKTGGNFTALSTGRISASLGGLIIGGDSNLEATDNITLSHESNDFGGSVSVSSAANLQIFGQNELVLGEISVSGLIDISTLGGDLKINQSITTTNSSTNAIQLIADINKSAGDPTGGNILITGNPTITVGPGGTAKLFSGSISDSEGLSDLVSIENIRYNSDPSLIEGDPIGDGVYVIFREKDCLNPDNAGEITGTQTICFETAPTIFTNNQSPSGETGTLEFMWQFTTLDPSGLGFDDSNWTDISNSNSASYQSSTLANTTWFRRLAKVECESDWSKALPSNSIVVTVDEATVSGHITGQNSITYGESTGDLVLSGNIGEVIKWQRRQGDSGTWMDLAITSKVYEESPAETGTWYYRAEVKSGVCNSVFTDAFEVEVSKKELLISGSFTALDKIYDGSEAAVFNTNNLSLSGIAGSDDVSLDNVVLKFNSPNVGENRSVQISSAGLSGTRADNYTLSLINAPTSTADITPASISVTPDSNQSKIYGSIDPIFTYTFNGQVQNETPSLIGNLGRKSGENVNNYNINIGTLALEDNGDFLASNYKIEFTDNITFQITAKQLSVIVDTGQSKVYGAADPVFTFKATGFENGDDEDVISGALARATGENVGNYAINLGSLSAGDNYDIDFNSADFTITKKTLVITADSGQSKVYGAADPVFTFKASGFENGDDEDVLTGTLSRAAGENVGNYAINLGSLSAGENYVIDFNSADFAITKKTLVITADAGQSKVYG
ncbi:MAG: MBG domain-containing protein, partial [Cyclobacteriaceae bacterium]